MLTQLTRWRKSQEGSVLSGLLIIVAFLSILGSALMGEISSQFLMTRNLVDQVTAQATVQSGMENAITKLQSRVVPPRCSTDQPNPIGPITINQQWTAANQIACRSIVPDVAQGLSAGAFKVDGTHITIGHDVYLVGDSSAAGSLYSYRFGKTGPLWKVSLGSAVTAPPAETTYSGHYLAAVPTGSRVWLVNDSDTSASVGCSMAASGTVTSQPGFGAGTSFPADTFFGDVSGELHVYDASCQLPDSLNPSVSLGSSIVGGPLVVPGTVTTNQPNGVCPGDDFGEQQRVTTTTADVFVLTSGGSLVDARWEEDSTNTDSESCWTTYKTLQLSFGNATGVSFYLNGTTELAAVSFAGGQVQLASITQSSANGGHTTGFIYNMSRGQSASLGGSMPRRPSWSPNGSEVGLADGSSLFVYDSGLKPLFRYDGSAAINTTPAADIGGDWYFGADDGYVYDVEPFASGTAMFKAARFGPGGQIHSSPIVGSTADGCAGYVCMYFGDSTQGSYFVQIGNIRVMELRSCITSGTSSTACINASASNPSLWARLEVGNPTYMQGRSVNVIGWAYSNGP